MRWLLIFLLFATRALGASTGVPVLDLDQSRIVDTWRGGLLVELQLSEAIPYAVGAANEPARMVLRFDRTVSVTGDPEKADRARKAQPPGLREVGLVSELHLPMTTPMLLRSAEIDWQEEGPRLRLLLTAADAQDFAAETARWARLRPPEKPPVTAHDGPLHVMIDPGHGGIDPGAEHGGVREADLALTMAKELAGSLREQGVTVSLTREDDSFVSLAGRVLRANRAGADVFVSLHADAVSLGHASGASVHRLPESAAAAADRFLLRDLGTLALAHGGAMDDTAARALMQVARRQTGSAAEALAETLVAALEAGNLPLYKIPLKQSNFVVLRAADMPSVLVELGYLSEAADRARLTDPAWRARMAEALSTGILAWAAAR